MVINGKAKWVYLLDELLEIKDFGLYLQGIVEMVQEKQQKNHIEKQQKQYQKIQTTQYHIQQ